MARRLIDIDEAPPAAPPETSDKQPLGGSSAQGRPYVGGSDMRKMGMGHRIFYWEGDEWRPLNTPQVVPTLQAQLIAAGLLDEGAVRPGFWDEKSASAYKNVLELANRHGLTAQQALQLLMQNPKFGDLTAALRGGGGGGGGGRSVTLVNPQDLRAVANEVAPQVIGRRLTADELARFTAAFHGAQRSGNPPSLDVAAQDFAESLDPTAAQGRDLVGVFDQVLRMMASGS